MKSVRYILCLALAAAAVSCAKVDPGTIADPVSDGGHLMVTITVGRDAGTKTGVSPAGLVSFTTDDRLSLFQTVDHASGGSTTSLVQSGAPTLIGDGEGASFSFDLDTSGIGPQDDITFRAGTGDWSLLSGNSAIIDIPANLSPASYPSGSVLPSNGVITLSDPISASLGDIPLALNGTVQLNHLVDYGTICMNDVPEEAGRITGIMVSESSGAGLAGPATFNISTGSFVDCPGQSVAISTSEQQQAQISADTGTSIWFTRLPAQLSSGSPSFTILLTDENGKQWKGVFTPHVSPDAPMPATGSVTGIDISSWSPSNP